MNRQIIKFFLHVSRACGLFYLARCATKQRLRILCYHGFSMTDEVHFRPNLFMTPEVFQQRMRYLDRKGFPVLPLSIALAGLEQGTLPACATVITIDDGFHSVYRVARNILFKHAFPATLYLTTYYFQKQVPIYRLVISYILWRATPETSVDLGKLDAPGLTKRTAVVLTPENKDWLWTLLVTYGEALGDELQRQSLARTLASAVNVDYETICQTRILNLVSKEEARELESAGIDIQLHTHRHKFPTELEGATRELADNIEAIAAISGKRPEHFCYPSGEWSPAHWAFLEEFNVDSAATCDTGLAVRGCEPYALPRVLDDMRVSQIEFEAEMCGYLDLIRDVRARL